jgi:hypothetical protein
MLAGRTVLFNVPLSRSLFGRGLVDVVVVAFGEDPGGTSNPVQIHIK